MENFEWTDGNLAEEAPQSASEMNKQKETERRPDKADVWLWGHHSALFQDSSAGFVGLFFDFPSAFSQLLSQASQLSSVLCLLDAASEPQLSQLSELFFAELSATVQLSLLGDFLAFKELLLPKVSQKSLETDWLELPWYPWLGSMFW